jgi:hypothetical protein
MFNYDLAGFPDKDGHMGRPVPTGQILVPQEIWLKDECIHWRRGQNTRMREVSRGMLNQFIRLTNEDSVLRFAQEWGVLALSGNLACPDSDFGSFYLPGRQLLEQGAEPVAAWQYYSKRALALINVAAALKRGKLGEVSDWGKFAALFSEPGQRQQILQWVEAGLARHNFGLRFSVISGYGTHEEILERARHAIANEVGEWFNCWKTQKPEGASDLALRWVDDQQRWDLQIDYHGLLFPAIALQLALVLADADSLYTCSGCGRPYVRPRDRKRPKSGWANYCAQCANDGVAQRRAAEAYRERLREAGRLHSAGVSVSEIAKQLNSTVARVRGWLDKGGNSEKPKTR